ATASSPTAVESAPVAKVSAPMAVPPAPVATASSPRAVEFSPLALASAPQAVLAAPVAVAPAPPAGMVSQTTWAEADGAAARAASRARLAPAPRSEVLESIVYLILKGCFRGGPGVRPDGGAPMARRARFGQMQRRTQRPRLATHRGVSICNGLHGERRSWNIPPMPAPSEFSVRFELVLKALSMSRGRLAAELGVDKSLVGRWASGAVTPSAHNLERLTHLVAERRSGFTLLDWEREPAELARLFGVEMPSGAGGGPAPVDGIPLPGLDAARAITAHRGALYEGFWRSTRPAVVAPGRFCQDHGIFRRGPSGLLEFELGNRDFRFIGWAMPFEGQLCVIASDPAGVMPSFLIMN